MVLKICSAAHPKHSLGERHLNETKHTSYNVNKPVVFCNHIEMQLFMEITDLPVKVMENDGRKAISQHNLCKC